MVTSFRPVGVFDDNRRTFAELINHRTQEGHMDTTAISIVTLMLTSLSYLVTFILGYGVRSYVYSQQRR